MKQLPLFPSKKQERRQLRWRRQQQIAKRELAKIKAMLNATQTPKS